MYDPEKGKDQVAGKMTPGGLTRREILGGVGVAAIFLTSNAAAAIENTGASVLTVYGKDFPQALDFAWRTARIDGPVIAIEGDPIRFYKARIENYRGVLQGYTTWSDYVLMRGLAEEHGLRLRAETKLASSGNGMALFRWVMA